MKEKLLAILAETPDRFQGIIRFYRAKHNAGFMGVFSCSAAEKFPNGWLKAIEAGVWPEDGVYGDNFRETFGLKRS